MACYDDDYDDKARVEARDLANGGHSRSIGELLRLLDAVVDGCLPPGEAAVDPGNGSGALYARHASQVVGVFIIDPPPTGGGLRVLRLLAVDRTLQKALGNAVNRA
ncbi:hypothetical protein [Paraburkholderia dioscoreae]|uniref:Uncharacterized protein n=1 Tax=Paraburkholderia dioscoreae TaxID=2604047 RepID=A0A5Q4YU62_9BURK|nr:hypothetical protein [Paraburkholderia dioscoreae]VVD29973.1 protein of unknown function [Paraburkholderia dioscoreae]